MVFKYKHIFGVIGLALLLHSFLLNSHLVDLLLDPDTDTDAIAAIKPSSSIHIPIAYYNYHNINKKHPAAPVQNKHHNKHKSAKHTGFKCLLDRTEIAYYTVRLNRDIHTAGQVSYYYLYFREINPPPPKLS